MFKISCVTCRISESYETALSALLVNEAHYQTPTKWRQMLNKYKQTLYGRRFSDSIVPAYLPTGQHDIMLPGQHYIFLHIT